MALTKASDILGLEKKVKEIAVPIGSLSASKVTVNLPDYSATNAAGAFEEIKENFESISEYSTNEKAIGKWIDGSEIFEKTFSDTLPVIVDNAFSTKTVDLSLLNIKDVIDYDVVIKQIVNDLHIFVKTPYLTNSGLQIKSNVDAAHYISIISNAAAYSECEFFATIRYTKATAETKKRTTKKGGK